MSDTIDVPAQVTPAPAPAAPMTVRDAVRALEPVKPQVTAAQAKIEAVATLTAKAYEKASELSLTPDEIAKLQADFPDEAFKPGAAGKEQLIYIEHAFLRDRLNDVLGIGQWALIPRSRWAEEFVSSNGKPASRVYVEAMLLVRGCFVAESVGEMEYWKNNASQNYGDAVEGAKTAALRRCCKEFGIGLQAWKKDWCDGWWARRRNGQHQPGQRGQQAPPAQSAPPPPTGQRETWPSVQVIGVKEVHSKPDAPKKWTAWFITFSDGEKDVEAGTFDTKVSELAKHMEQNALTGTLVTEPGKKQGSRSIVSLDIETEDPDGTGEL